MTLLHDGHLTAESLRRFESQELEPGELIVVLRHIAMCAECAGRTPADAEDDRAALRQMVAAPADAAHLDTEGQLMPYVDGTLDPADRDVVESHLEDCAVCRAEVADLRAFRAPAAPQRPAVRRSRWLALAAALAGIMLLLAMLNAFRERRAAPVERIPPVVTATTTTAVEPKPEPQPEPVRPVYANAEWNRWIAAAAGSGRLPYPADLALLTSPQDVLRGSGGTAEAGIAPAGIVVDDPRPELTWPEVEGATYGVSIFDEEEVVARSPVLDVARWKPEQALRRGRTYVWQVKVTRGGTTDIIPAPPAPQAMFRIAGEAQHRAVQQALAEHPNDRLLHAVLYARAGLRAEAEAALRDAAAAGDADASTIVRGSSR